jgi:hypothetical protein
LIRNVVRLNGAPPGTAECILLSQEPELIDAVMDAVIRITDQIASAHGGGPLSLAPRVERKVEDIMLVAPKSSGIWGITERCSLVARSSRSAEQPRPMRAERLLRYEQFLNNRAKEAFRS